MHSDSSVFCVFLGLLKTFVFFFLMIMLIGVREKSALKGVTNFENGFLCITRYN